MGLPYYEFATAGGILCGCGRWKVQPVPWEHRLSSPKVPPYPCHDGLDNLGSSYLAYVPRCVPVGKVSDDILSSILASGSPRGGARRSSVTGLIGA